VSRNSVLLLGGAGFIGSALTARLQREGVPVRVVDRENVQHLPQWLSDCYAVVHLANATTPGLSAAKPDLERANLDLTEHLVGCLRAYPEVHLIYFSSGGTVYGNPEQLPVSEDAPLSPLSPYGIAKVAQEAICRELDAHGHHAVTILRPSNAYGPGQTVKSGFGLVRTLLGHALLGTTMEIWGDGNSVRDYIYIDDIVEATLSLVHRPQDAGLYNLGSGVGHSINQVKQLVEQMTGFQVHTEYRHARGTDVRAVVLDSSRLRDRLGWRAGMDLAMGLELTWMQIAGKR
jgi:UDP-glucose 4-epimerase